MDKIIDPHSSDTWKNQLTIAINFISSKNTEKHNEVVNERLIMMLMKLLMISLSHFFQNIKII